MTQTWSQRVHLQLRPRLTRRRAGRMSLIVMKANKSLPSNEEWQAWAKVDPLYAVATLDGRAKSGGNPWTETSFYEIGAPDQTEVFVPPGMRQFMS